MDNANPRVAGSTSNLDVFENTTARKLEIERKRKMIESIRKPIHLDDDMNAKKARVWEFCASSNLSLKNSTASFARIEAILPSDSLIVAKMGERARPSSRFSSRVLVTKMRRTERKYHCVQVTFDTRR